MAVNNNNFFDGPFFDGPFFDVGTLISGGGSGPSQGSQGLPPYAHARPQTKEQKRKSREDFGIIPKAKEVIAAVAQSQAERLEQDSQKQFEELSRELDLKGIEFDARYLEALNLQRERLIDAEIQRRLKQDLEDKQTMQLLMIAASA